MNRQQRKLFISFGAFSVFLIVAATIVFSYSVYRAKQAEYGDFLEKYTFNQTWIWVEPTLVSIGGLFLAGLALFTVFWRLLDTNGFSKSERDSNGELQ